MRFTDPFLSPEIVNLMPKNSIKRLFDLENQIQMNLKKASHSTVAAYTSTK